MTTPFISRFFGLLVSIALVSNSFAQENSIRNLQPVLTNGTYIKVYENIRSEFQKIFANAENVSWYTIDKNFLAKFFIDGLEKRALFNPKGKLIYEMSYGKEKHLPADIRKNVKRSYVEYAITSATLVEESNRSIWVINLEDEFGYAIVRVENNELEEVKKYLKVK